MIEIEETRFFKGTKPLNVQVGLKTTFVLCGCRTLILFNDEVSANTALLQYNEKYSTSLILMTSGTIEGTDLKLVQDKTPDDMDLLAMLDEWRTTFLKDNVI